MLRKNQMDCDKWPFQMHFDQRVGKLSAGRNQPIFLAAQNIASAILVLGPRPDGQHWEPFRLTNRPSTVPRYPVAVGACCICACISKLGYSVTVWSPTFATASNSVRRTTPADNRRSSIPGVSEIEDTRHELIQAERVCGQRPSVKPGPAWMRSRTSSPRMTQTFPLGSLPRGPRAQALQHP